MNEKPPNNWWSGRRKPGEFGCFAAMAASLVIPATAHLAGQVETLAMRPSHDKSLNASCRHQTSSFRTMISLGAIILLAGWRSQGAGADLVDITAEFRCTNRVQLGTRQYPHEWSHAVHCVLGTNL